MALTAGASCLVLVCGGQIKQPGLERDKTIVIGFRIWEKMLEDNAKLLGLLAHAYRIEPREIFRDTLRTNGCVPHDDLERSGARRILWLAGCGRTLLCAVAWRARETRCTIRGQEFLHRLERVDGERVPRSRTRAWRRIIANVCAENTRSDLERDVSHGHGLVPFRHAGQCAATAESTARPRAHSWMRINSPAMQII